MSQTWKERATDSTRGFKRRYPNIRLMDEDCTLITVDGRAERYNHKRLVRPLLMLNRDSECTPQAIRGLLEKGVYRKLFCDVARLENSAHLDFNTPRRLDEPSAIPPTLLTRHFYHTPVHHHPHIHHYRHAKNDVQRQKALAQWYDESIRALGPRPEEVLAKRAKAFHANNDGISDLNLQQSRARLGCALSNVDPDFLEILNAVGCQIMVVCDPRDVGIGSVNGFCSPEQGLLGANYLVAGRSGVLREEITHYVDMQLGFSNQSEWKRAVKHDIGFVEASEFLRRSEAMYIFDFRYDSPRKNSLFDTASYGEKYRPMEMLADVHFADMHFDKVVRELGRQYDNGADPRLRKLLTLIEEGGGRKESAMLLLFPQTWPLYKEFIDRVRARADMIRDRNQENRQQSRDWVSSLAAAGINPEYQTIHRARR